jgi:pyrroloquinoline quinone biosynthesis protein D
MNQRDSIPLKGCPTLAPQVRFRLDPVSGDPLLLYPEGVLVLNATAADIARHCDGKTTTTQILAQMSDEYQVDETALHDDVLDCLADLSRRTLLIFLP